jgi:hypothetical protein
MRGAALSAALHTHRRLFSLIHTSNITPDDLLRCASDTNIGDAGSTRWIAFLV